MANAASGLKTVRKRPQKNRATTPIKGEWPDTPGKETRQRHRTCCVFADKSARLVYSSLGGSQAQCKHDITALPGHASVTSTAHRHTFRPNQLGEHWVARKSPEQDILSKWVWHFPSNHSTLELDDEVAAPTAIVAARQRWCSSN